MRWVRMELSDRTSHLVNAINRVTGFLSAQGKPMPMRDDAVNAIRRRIYFRRFDIRAIFRGQRRFCRPCRSCGTLRQRAEADSRNS